MDLHIEYLRYGDKNQFSAYVAAPAGAKGLPGLIIGQEAWGVDDHIESVARRFAQEGYVALAPDLFAHDGARPPASSREMLNGLRRFMDGLPPTAWGDAAARDEAMAKLPRGEAVRVKEAFASNLAPILTGKVDMQSFDQAFLAGANLLRSAYPASRGHKVGVVGYCMGGALAASLACNDPELAAAVIYYGRAPAAERIASIKCPILGNYGELDGRVNEGIPAFEAAMKKHGKSFEPHVYKGAAHAFSNDERPSYNEAATVAAYARTLAFFKKHLS